MVDMIAFFNKYYPIILIIVLLTSIEAYGLYIRTHHKPTKQQKKAQNPTPSKRWLFKNPEGIILGRYKNYFFSTLENFYKGGLVNILTLGGSGSGKSTLLGTTLITTSYHKRIDPTDTAIPNFLVVDLKGELHELISCDNSFDDYYLIDPTDREHSVGWDPYYRLRGVDPPYDLKVDVFSSIARALIPSNDKDKYFSENAISMLTGLLSYGFDNGRELIDIVDEILTGNLPELVTDAYEHSDRHSISARFLGKFQKKRVKDMKTYVVH